MSENMLKDMKDIEKNLHDLDTQRNDLIDNLVKLKSQIDFYNAMEDVEKRTFMKDAIADFEKK